MNQSDMNLKLVTLEENENSLAPIFENKLKWMNSKEAAAYIRVSVGQMRNMVWRRQIKAYYVTNRLRFLRSDLDLLLKAY